MDQSTFNSISKNILNGLSMQTTSRDNSVINLKINLNDLNSIIDMLRLEIDSKYREYVNENNTPNASPTLENLDKNVMHLNRTDVDSVIQLGTDAENPDYLNHLYPYEHTGEYYCLTANLDNVLLKPDEVKYGFRLWVLGGAFTTTESNHSGFQIMIETGGSFMFVRYSMALLGEWTPWKKIAMAEDVPHLDAAHRTVKELIKEDTAYKDCLCTPAHSDDTISLDNLLTAGEYKSSSKSAANTNVTSASAPWDIRDLTTGDFLAGFRLTVMKPVANSTMQVYISEPTTTAPTETYIFVRSKEKTYAWSPWERIILLTLFEDLDTNTIHLNSYRHPITEIGLIQTETYNNLDNIVYTKSTDIAHEFFCRGANIDVVKAATPEGHFPKTLTLGFRIFDMMLATYSSTKLDDTMGALIIIESGYAAPSMFIRYYNTYTGKFSDWKEFGYLDDTKGTAALSDDERYVTLLTTTNADLPKESTTGLIDINELPVGSYFTSTSTVKVANNVYGPRLPDECYNASTLKATKGFKLWVMLSGYYQARTLVLFAITNTTDSTTRPMIFVRHSYNGTSTSFSWSKWFKISYGDELGPSLLLDGHNVTHMAANEDLNNYLLPGNYEVTYASTAGTIVHAPWDFDPSITATGFRLMIMQITNSSEPRIYLVMLTRHEGGRMYFRSYLGYGWSDWSTYVSSVDLAAEAAARQAGDEAEAAARQAADALRLVYEVSPSKYITATGGVLALVGDPVIFYIEYAKWSDLPASENGTFFNFRRSESMSEQFFLGDTSKNIWFRKTQLDGTLIYDWLKMTSKDEVAAEETARMEADNNLATEIYTNLLSMEGYRNKINAIMAGLYLRPERGKMVQTISPNEHARGTLDDQLKGTSLYEYDDDTAPEEAPLSYKVSEDDIHGTVGFSATLGTTTSTNRKHLFYIPNGLSTSTGVDKYSWDVGRFIFKRQRYPKAYATDRQWEDWHCINGVRKKDCPWYDEYNPIEIVEQPTAVSDITYGSTYTVKVLTKGEHVKYQWQGSKDGGQTWYNRTIRLYNHPLFSGIITSDMIDPTEGKEFYMRCILTCDDPDKTVTTNAVRIQGLCASATTTGAYTYNGSTSKIVFCYTTINSGCYSEAYPLEYLWECSIDGTTWVDVPNAATKDLVQSMPDENAQYVRLKIKCTLVPGAYCYTAVQTIKAIDHMSIETDPSSVTANIGTIVSFNVKPTGGSGIYTYKWQYKTATGSTFYNGTLVTHDTATYTFDAIPDRNGYQYRCIVTDKVFGDTTSKPSNIATLTVVDPTEGDEMYE